MCGSEYAKCGQQGGKTTATTAVTSNSLHVVFLPQWGSAWSSSQFRFNAIFVCIRWCAFVYVCAEEFGYVKLRLHKFPFGYIWFHCLLTIPFLDFYSPFLIFFILSVKERWLPCEQVLYLKRSFFCMYTYSTTYRAA